VLKEKRLGCPDAGAEGRWDCEAKLARERGLWLAGLTAETAEIMVQSRKTQVCVAQDGRRRQRRNRRRWDGVGTEPRIGKGKEWKGKE
jgi:hypothetical protein